VSVVTDFEFTDGHHLEHIEAAVNATGPGTVETTYVEPGDDDGRFETIEYDRDSDGRVEAVLRASVSVSDDVRRIPGP
jgi:hypothetical protein